MNEECDLSTQFSDTGIFELFFPLLISEGFIEFMNHSETRLSFYEVFVAPTLFRASLKQVSF